MRSCAEVQGAVSKDLCIDVYDEAERRLTNAILEPNFEENGELIECLQNCSVHARQKLGRLSVTEFRTLVVDVLTEAANRLTPLLENATVRRRDAGASRLPLIGATRSAASRHPSQPHHNYSTYEQTPHPPSLPSQASIPPPPPPLPSPSPQSAKATSRMCIFEDPVYDQSALKAAFSAGMVMSHKRPSEGNELDHSSNEASSRCTSNGVVEQTQSPVACPKKLTYVHKVEEEEEEKEYCYNDDISGIAAKVSAQSNYAVGTQCLDSGILLHQGISLLGAATPPGQSETSRNPISTQAAVTAARTSCSLFVAIFSITSPGSGGGFVKLVKPTCIQRAYADIFPSSVAIEESWSVDNQSSARKEVYHSPRMRFRESSSADIATRWVTTAEFHLRNKIRLDLSDGRLCWACYKFDYTADTVDVDNDDNIDGGGG
ncbi:unnamed protein product [Schistocephalus solidus]|uniref:GIT Spa2 homology (SHD) domain-containing protein n=1 Tax=Schistocephalus solidus TaxID=70667 RepID=A0A183SEU3_SCHSO|nr:unnamed protein product [Schistocephalus solidus]